MMDYTAVLEALDSCGVDTAEEQLILRQRIKAARRPVLLVAGDEPGRPLDLLAGLGVPPLAAQGGPLSFPVQCMRAPQLELAAVDGKGETHHYFDVPSFLAHGGADTVSLTIMVDAPVLESADLRFITVDRETVRRLPELAGDCVGVVLALDGTAGAPEPAATELGRWLKHTSGMADRICLVLNHAERGFVNWMLEEQLDVTPRSTLPCEFDAPPEAEESPRAILAAAAELLRDSGSSADDGSGLAAQCVRSARSKLEARREELRAAAEKKAEAAKWFYDNSRKFQAKMEMAGTAMKIQLTQLQREELYADIKGMKQQLVSELPQMGRELAEQNGKQAKQDIQNLAGEYAEALCNSYIEFLTGQITDNLLMPQAEKAFQSALDEYKNMMTNAPIPVGEQSALQDANLLKSVQFNLGDFRTGLAQMLGAIVRAVMVVVGFETFGFGVFRLAKILGEAVAEGADSILKTVQPPKPYVDLYIKSKLVPALDKAPDVLFQALDQTILPQINGDVANWFNDMVASRCALLDRQGEALDREAKELFDQRAALQTGYDKLTALL